MKLHGSMLLANDSGSSNLHKSGPRSFANRSCLRASLADRRSSGSHCNICNAGPTERIISESGHYIEDSPSVDPERIGCSMEYVFDRSHTKGDSSNGYNCIKSEANSLLALQSLHR